MLPEPPFEPVEPTVVVLPDAPLFELGEAACVVEFDPRVLVAFELPVELVSADESDGGTSTLAHAINVAASALHVPHRLLNSTQEAGNKPCRTKEAMM